MSDDLVLYVDAFYISRYAFSCFVALREKGIPFTTRVVPLQDKAQQRPEYRDRSRTARQWQRAAVREWVERERIPLVPYDG